mgnify:CR=1 FL=1
MYLALVENYGDIRNKLNLFVNLAPIAIIGDKDETSIFKINMFDQLFDDEDNNTQ